MKVLFLHNYYRTRGGEERCLEVMEEALRQAGVETMSLLRDSGDTSRMRAGWSMVRGGSKASDVTKTVAEFQPDVVHVHNLNPMFGWRALEAVKNSKTRPLVVMHLHNFRIFCAIGTSYRDGRPCFRCQQGNVLPGLRLRCRGSLVESSSYALALHRQQARLFELVDQFIAPSQFATDQLVRLGLPSQTLNTVNNPLLAGQFAERSHADEGSYALFAGRLSQEKGIDLAAEACVAAKVPLVVAGDGPLADQLRAEYSDSSKVRFLGHVDRAKLAQLRQAAAMEVIPSRGPEVFPFACLEAMATGLPIVASAVGGLPEMVGPDQTLPPSSVTAWQKRIEYLISNPKQRKLVGENNLAKAQSHYRVEKFLSELGAVYGANLVKATRNFVL